jgi:subtilisin family serine protease
MTTPPSGKQELNEYNYFLKLKADYDKQLEENKNIRQNLLDLKDKIITSENILKSYFQTDSLNEESLTGLKSGIDSIDESAEFLTRIKSQKLDIKKLDEGISIFEKTINYKLNPEFDSRYIVGDHYEDFTVKNYGNNYVEGPDAFHGTHVAGIICADRQNNTGIKGIADNVGIMVLRVVPTGDERDKDVANAVYYAVNNGARVINMSFGKDYSPYKEYVDDAFRYADDHGVLIVHAAGNDSKNTGISPSYPVKLYKNNQGECKNWIEVGALSWKDGVDIAGGFTNYGRKSVDIFAPGVELYSTVPNQGYRNASGTSMAAPVVTGVAALVLSYYPDLSASDVKKILLKSAVNYKKQKVKMPGRPQELTSFGKLSKTGGVVNAYNALKEAEKY